MAPDAEVDSIQSFRSVPRHELMRLWHRFCNQQVYYDLEELCNRVSIEFPGTRKPSGAKRRIALQDAHVRQIIAAIVLISRMR